MPLEKYIGFFSACFSIIFFTSCNSRNTLFTEVSSSESNIDFINQPAKNDHLNILYYIYYYNGGGVSVGDINNDGLPDIYFTANKNGGNKLFLNKGNFVFEDITDKANITGSSDWCSGVTMADVNSDGFLDIYVSAVANYLGLKGHNELFINNGNNTFTESAAKYGLDLAGLSTQAAFFDYDHDGDLDCYILRHSTRPHANIVDTSRRHMRDSISGDRLFRNDLNAVAAKFTDVSTEAGIYQSSLGYGLGLAVADINNDGWEDVYVGNDFHENDYYYINKGNGTFIESGANHFRHYSRFSMGNDVADYNNDGQLDVITVDMLPPDEKTLKTYGSDENPDIYKQKLEINGYQYQYSKNCLQRNNGNGINFSETGLINNVAATDWSWAPLFADFDNDGIKDLFISTGIVQRPVDLDYVKFVSNEFARKQIGNTNKNDDSIVAAMPDGSSHPFLFKGNADKPFADVSNEWGTGKLKGYYNGSAYADLDNDGDLDLVINCINSKALVLRNNTTGKRSVTISFKGDSLNRFGVGAKAYLFTNGKIQYQQLMPTRGFQSSVDARLCFGMDSLNTADSILVVWPNQQYEVLKNIPSNKPIAVDQKNSAGTFLYNSYFRPAEEEFTIANIQVPWKHNENDFLDYNVQYLIPHAESTRGPKIAVADVNGDGLDDMYACGAKNQPGTLLVQQANNSFIKTDTAVFNTDAICEDVDAVFFDADRDKDPDLFVVSGGNELSQQTNAFEDRLYFNDGKGHFTKALNFISQKENKSCVAVADIDNDGDNDLFLGTLADPAKYGIPKTSFLFVNDGKGNFTLADNNKINLNSIGMVTSAAFADLDKDGWQDLIVTGEWMAVKIFMNNKGVFTGKDILQSTGLWQTIFPADINGDDAIDLLAGNWGHNTKLSSGKNGPCKLYTNDFDKNGAIEQLLCYTINEKEYTFLAKDELERRIPVLKKYYLKYSNVAGKTVQYMFYDLFKNYMELKAEVLSSSCLINDGKGNFTRIDLPDEIQLAPVMSFAKAAEPGKFIAGGNFYGTIPYEGRYDALSPTEFSFDKASKRFVTGSAIQTIDGEIRDIKWINTAGNVKIVLLARNNRDLVFLKYKKD